MTMTVNGQHSWVHEQLHPIWSQDPQHFSQKYGKAGHNYKLDISLFKSQVVSMKGPYTAGADDLKFFITKGLKQQLLADGIKAIGDGGYHGHQKSISAPNLHDSAGVRLFKSHALKWHETFNGLMNFFEAVDSTTVLPVLRIALMPFASFASIKLRLHFHCLISL
jgi:hypothetical protein